VECGVWSEITLEGEICGRSILTPHSTLLTPRFLTPRFLEEPGGATTTPETMTDGITGTEVLITGESRYFMKGLHQIRGQRQKFFQFEIRNL
jgi:hypothetical protein